METLLAFGLFSLTATTAISEINLEANYIYLLSKVAAIVFWQKYISEMALSKWISKGALFEIVI